MAKSNKYKFQLERRAQEYKRGKAVINPTYTQLKNISKGGKIDPKDKTLYNVLFDNKTGWQTNFFSTNVKAYKAVGNNLVVQYLDNSVYVYYGAAKIFYSLLKVGSKGKWVWRNLIRTNITYAKIR